MKVYCVHPISGLSYQEVMEYYNSIEQFLNTIGYDVLCPMKGKDAMRTEVAFRSHGYDNTPISTNHAIFGRDQWMIRQSDIVFANLSGAKNVSIGSCMELAWASMLGKHVIVVMEKENIHVHTFVLEAADIIFEDLESAKNYMSRLIG